MKQLHPPSGKPQFPVLRITNPVGSPHTKNAVITIDGEPLRAQRLELVLDVNDAIRLRVFEVVSVDIETPVTVVENAGVHVKVTQFETSELPDGEIFVSRRTRVAEGKGRTLSEALRAAAIEAEAFELADPEAVEV